MIRGKRATWIACALPVLIGAWACSASSGSDKLGSNANGSGGGSGSGAENGAGGSSGSGSGGDIFGSGNSFNVSGGAPGTGTDGGCFGTSSQAEPYQTTTTVTHTVPRYIREPFDMFIMYDQSGSMNDDTPQGSKWDTIKQALIGFINRPDSAGIGMGIGYFPLEPPPCGPGDPNCDCINIIITQICTNSSGGSCDPSLYATPDVPIAILPGANNAQVQAITDSINRHGPGGGTPTRPALEGAHRYADPWAAMVAPKKTIVILATDGEPTGCSSNSVQDVANIAANSFNATPSVPTWVIGVGSSLTSLNSIATAGGTPGAIIVDTANGDPTQQFIDAMNQIANATTVYEEVTEEVTDTIYTQVECEWTIPDAPEGQTFDKNKVNVEFAVADSTPQRIGAVATPTECDSAGGGWHFDDPANPTKVIVCPQTCSTVQAVPGGRIEVVFGCETEYIIR